MPVSGRQRYLLALFAAYLLLWGVLAIEPQDRSDWLLENALVFGLSRIHISEPTRQEAISYAVFCLKKKI